MFALKLLLLIYILNPGLSLVAVTEPLVHDTRVI